MPDMIERTKQRRKEIRKKTYHSINTIVFIFYFLLIHYVY